MANILGESKFFIILRGISTISRFFISIFCLSFLSLFSFWFFYNSVSYQIKHQKFLFKDFNNQKDLLAKTSKELKILENKYKLLLKDYKNDSNQNFIFSKKIDFFFENIKKHSLKCVEFQPVGKSKKTSYKRYYYFLKMQGNFSDLVSFLDDINKTAGSLKFKNIDIQTLEKGNILFLTKIRLIKFIKDDVEI